MSSEAETRGLVGVIAAILLLTAFTYAPSLEFKYVQDAYHLVKANPVVERADPAEIFTSDFCKDTASRARSLYRPITIASYAIERSFAGEASPVVSHLFGAIVHALTAIALFLLARRLRTGAGVAAAASLLFAVHPLMMQGVVNVAARGDLLVTLFSLAALLCYTRAGSWPGEPSPRPGVERLAAWGTAVCLFLALGSKEPAVVVPLLLAAIDALYRFPQRPAGRTWWIERAAALAPSLLACVVYLVLRTLAIGSIWGLPTAPVEDNVLAAGLAPGAHWATVLAILARYTVLLFWPAHMSGDYSGATVPAEPSWLAPLPLLGLAVALLALTLVVVPAVAALRGRSGARKISLAALLFVLPYLVIGNVLALNAASLAERWLYFPATGALLLFAVALGRLARLVPRRSGRTSAVLAVVVAAASLLGLAAFTRHASRMWATNAALFEQCLRATPTSLRAYSILGGERRSSGDLQGALDLFEQGLRYNPDHVPLWVEKGVTLWRMGRLDDAERAFRMAVALRPDDGQAQMHLGLLLAQRGLVAEAGPALRKALVYAPYLVPAAEALGDIAFREGRFREAARYYGGCVRLGREDLRPKLEAAARRATASPS